MQPITPIKLQQLFTSFIITTLILSQISTIHADEETLLDTRQETLELNWQALPAYGGWEESSVNSAGRDYRQLMVCNVMNEDEDNWIRTGYIPNSSKAELLYIDISFSVRTCTDLVNVRSCRESFNLHFYETDNQALEISKSNFQKFQRIDTIAAEGRFDPGNMENAFNFKTRTFSLKGKSNGFYVAIQDKGACLSIQYIRIYYKYCPETTMSFVHFPRTMTGEDQFTQVAAKGACIDNAVGARRLGFPVRYCNGNGKWAVQETGQCHCDKGFEEDKDTGRCVACEQDFYKTSAGSDVCRRCPLYSTTDSNTGTTECQCMAGTFRAKNEDLHEKCSRPPGTITMAKSIVNGTEVKLLWNEPQDLGGRDLSDLKYQVQCAICLANKSAISSNCKTLSTCSTTDRYLRSTSHSVYSLQPKTIYRFRIYAYNSVSEFAINPESGPDYYELHVETDVIDEATIAPPLVTIQPEDLDQNNNVQFDPSQFEDNRNEEETDAINRLFLNKQLAYLMVSGIICIVLIFVLIWCCVWKRYTQRGTASVIATRKIKGDENGIGYPFSYSTRCNASGGIVNGFSCNNSTGTAESRLEEATLIQGLNRSPILDNVESSPTMLTNRYSNGQLVDTVGTMGTYGWKYRTGDQLRNYVPIGNNVMGPVYHQPGVSEIDECLIQQTRTIAVHEEMTISRGTMQLRGEENMAMPIGIITFNNTSADRLIHFLSKSKACPYILTIEGIVRPTSSNYLTNKDTSTASSSRNTIITEALEYASLRAYLAQNKDQISSAQKLQLVHQCCQAVEYSHSCLSHTLACLTLDNFGINDEGEVRLIHFDKKWGMIDANVDPAKYCPPNNAGHVCTENDVWQLAVLIWEILSDNTAYEGLSSESVVTSLEQGIRLPSPGVKKCPASLYHLLLQCWLLDPSGRPNMTTVCSEVRRIVTSATSGARKKAKNKFKKNGPQQQTRSYSSIGTLETSSNEGHHHHHQQARQKSMSVTPKHSTFSSSSQLNSSKLEVVPIRDDKVDIRLLDRGTTIEV